MSTEPIYLVHLPQLLFQRIALIDFKMITIFFIDVAETGIRKKQRVFIFY